MGLKSNQRIGEQISVISYKVQNIVVQKPSCLPKGLSIATLSCISVFCSHVSVSTCSTSAFIETQISVPSFTTWTLASPAISN